MVKRARAAFTKIQALIIIAIVGAAAVAAAYYFTLPKPPSSPEVIKIGVVYPFTGSGAEWGNDIKFAADFMEDLVNNYHDWNVSFAKWQGIPSLGNRKIQFVYADHQGKNEIAKGETARLITEEGVVGILGCFSSGVTLVARDVCEQYHVPILTESGAMYLFNSTYEYFWGVGPHIEQSFGAGGKFVEAMVKEKGATVSKMGILTDQSYRWVIPVWEAYANKNGWGMYSDTYDAGKLDFSAEVQKLIAAGVDVLSYDGTAVDEVAFLKEIKRSGYKPKVIVLPLWQAVMDQLGTDSNYICGYGFFISDEMVKVRPDYAQVNAYYKSKFSRNIDDNGGRFIVAATVLIDAIEKAASTDTEEINKKIKATNFDASDIISPYGVQFNQTVHYNLKAAVVPIVQIVNKTRRIIYPFDMATAAPVWPFPGW